MGRIYSDANPALAILAGPLSDALHLHAALRLYHFFMFLFCHKALTDRLKTIGVAVAEGEGVSAKATHQIAFGMRSDNPGYYDFVTSDPDVVNQPSTACGKTDAAHFCNLGLTPAFRTKVAPHISEGGDPLAGHFYRQCEIHAGKTRQLPQRINIGPDRVIDRVHGQLAGEILDGSAPVSAKNFNLYVGTCAQEMQSYRAKILQKNYLGLAACCECYLQVYANAPGVRSPWTAGQQMTSALNTVSAEAMAHGLPEAAYIDRTVI